jgi:ABC-type transporter Mla subunit MlaD
VTNQEVEQIKGHFDKVSQEIRADLREGIAEVRHYTGVVAEDLRSEIRAVAEGVALANERIGDVDLRVDSLTGRVDSLTGHVTSLTGQVSSLTGQVSSLTGRVDALTGSMDALTGSVDGLTGSVDTLTGRVDGLTGEVRRGFASVRAEIHHLHETDDELRRRIEAQEQRGA